MKTGCVILAGGKSSRMGTDKALLEVGGRNFIEQIADELSWFDEKLIARGCNSSLSDLLTSWTVISDIYPDHGPLGGIHAALSACESDALFVVTCDMPFLQSSLARRLCAVMEESPDTDVVITAEENGRMHPLCGVYRKSACPVLEAQILANRNRVMEALDKLNVKCVTVTSSGDLNQLSNINTPQDYQKLKNKV